MKLVSVETPEKSVCKMTFSASAEELEADVYKRQDLGAEFVHGVHIGSLLGKIAVQCGQLADTDVVQLDFEDQMCIRDSYITVVNAN